MSVQNSIFELLSYNWKDERINFEETFNIKINDISSFDILSIIKQHPQRDEMERHIFFHLVYIAYHFAYGN